MNPPVSKSSTSPAILTEDPILRHLVDLANEHGIACNVTVTVGGAIIAGEIVSAKKYWSDVGTLFASPIDGLTRDESVTASRAFLAVAKEAGTGFLHLKDVRILSPGDLQGALNMQSRWRIRLASIDGFMVGVPSVQGSDRPDHIRIERLRLESKPPPR